MGSIICRSMKSKFYLLLVFGIPDNGSQEGLAGISSICGRGVLGTSIADITGVLVTICLLTLTSDLICCRGLLSILFQNYDVCLKREIERAYAKESSLNLSRTFRMVALISTRTVSSALVDVMRPK